VKIVLVEWAAYPLYRNKVVDGRVVRCGLGRMLDSMRRHDPGLPVDVTVIINGAGDAQAATGRDAQPGLRGKLQHLMEKQRQLSLARRMRAYTELTRKYPFIEAVHFRDNEGQDFGAYDYGYQLLQQQGHDGDVLFMNSSVSGPHEHGWLLKYRGQFRRHPNVGLCGIALNSHDTSDGDGPFAPHVQSYFLYTNMKVLEHAIGPRLFSADVHDKLDVIRHGEIGVSERVLNAGYSITSSAFPEFAYRRGDAWAIPWGDLRYSRRLRLPVNTI
jgi:lipopolysaccharide biosynthesis protein